MKEALVMVGAIVVAALVAGCQAAAPSPPASPKEAAKAAVASPQQELYEAAKREGKVIFYTLSWTDEEVERIVGAFTKKYPGIEVSTTKAASSDTINRILVEAPAGRLSLDVTLAALSNIEALIDRDLLVGHDWAKVADITKENIHLDGRFIATYDAPFGWYYNSKVVAAADVPKKWEDLLSPRWKGRKMTVPTVGAIGVEALPIKGIWDQQKYLDYLAKLKEQELVVEASSATIVDKIAAGQIPLGVGGLTFVASAKAKGAPIEVAPLGPLTTQRFGVYIPKGVPHPNAAKLLMSFLGDRETLEVWKQNKRGPATPCDASEVAKLLCDAKIEPLLEDGGKVTKAMLDYMQLNRKTLGLPSGGR